MKLDKLTKLTQLLINSIAINNRMTGYKHVHVKDEFC